MNAKDYYEEMRKAGLTDDITSNDEPDYNQPFYQSIFRLMEGFSKKNETAKLGRDAVSHSYLILSGEGSFDTEHQFCAEFDDIDKCNAFFERLKSGEFKDTYLYIYEAVKLREE